jgi:hypothetical protein
LQTVFYSPNFVYITEIGIDADGEILRLQIVVLTEMTRAAHLASASSDVNANQASQSIRHACQKLGFLVLAVFISQSGTGQVDPTLAQRLASREDYFHAFCEILCSQMYGKVIRNRGLTLVALQIVSLGFLTSQPNWKLSSDLFNILSPYMTPHLEEGSLNGFLLTSTKLDLAVAIAAATACEASFSLDLRLNIIRQCYTSKNQPWSQHNILLLLGSDLMPWSAFLSHWC